MRLSLKEWVVFFLIALFCFALWLRLGYSRFAFVDLSVNRAEAQSIAGGYLDSLGVDAAGYSKAMVFVSDNWADRYLQKTLGSDAEEEFVRKHDYELFAWRIRFFKELQKEEYFVDVSSKSGRVIGFRHFIEDIEPRRSPGKAAARARGAEFLKLKFGLDMADYTLHEEKEKRFEKRVDYAFSWEKNGVYIPWGEDQGGAKLLVGATVSGDEVREFYQGNLDIPEKFHRYIERQLIFGEYLSSFSFLSFIFLLMCAITIVVKRRYALAVRLSKKYYIYFGSFLAAMALVYIFNNFQELIISYPTSATRASFIGVYFTKLLINIIFLSVTFMLPGIAGESLHNEVFDSKRSASFLSYIKSTFLGRSLAHSIALGYLIFIILLGVQAVMFHLGQKHLGVWTEWIKLTRYSSAYLPFLGAFIIGSRAALSEEVMFRLFGLSLAKRYLKNTLIAVVLISVVWGLGHSEYAIFPVWFRALEVSILGIIFSFLFLRYGLIAVLVAHYLFDVFWGTAAYILGRSQPHLFIGSVVVLAIPLVYALFAYFANKDEREREVGKLLDPIQKYNLGVLEAFISVKSSEGLSPEEIRGQLLAHNWDVDLADLALDHIFKKGPK
ncbi:CPBP family intramembrane glutamic endopeptidase [Candidatus Omnitrophota bacterium]